MDCSLHHITQSDAAESSQSPRTRVALGRKRPGHTLGIFSPGVKVMPRIGSDSAAEAQSTKRLARAFLTREDQEESGRRLGSSSSSSARIHAHELTPG